MANLARDKLHIQLHQIIGIKVVYSNVFLDIFNALPLPT